MTRRKYRSAIEIVSDIGSLGCALRDHSDADISAAVALLREANPQIFTWLVRALTVPQEQPA